MREFRAYMQYDILMKDLATAILAAAIGLSQFRKLGLFYRILLLQVLTYIVIDSIAFFMHKNVWLYNLYILVEFALLFTAAANEFRNKRLKKIVLYCYLVVLAMSIPELIFVKMNNDFVYVTVLSGYFVCTCIYTYLVYHKANPTENTQVDVSLVLTSFGVVIYCAGAIPCLAAMRKLMPIDMGLSQQLFQNIVVMLGELRYFLLALGLFLARKRILFNWN